jgi:hypothetical protein
MSLEPQKIYLTRRDKQDLKAGCPHCIYRASNGCGVFESEETFLTYLRTYEAPRRGECWYLGIKNEKELKIDEIVKVYAVNYEVVIPTPPPPVKKLMGTDLIAGAMAVVVSQGPYYSHLVLKQEDRLVDITDGRIHWTCGGAHVEVRLLEPGEERIIRGR